MKKKSFFALGVATTTLVLGVAAFKAINHSSLEIMHGTEETFTIVLDKDNVPAGITADYQTSPFTASVTTNYGNAVNLNFLNAKSAANKFVHLAYNGMIYNFGANGDPFTGITGVTVTLSSGSVTLSTSQFGQPGTALLNNPVSLTSGVKQTVPFSNYFMIKAGDTGADIDSISIDYACKAKFGIEQLYGSYTGTGKNGADYSIVFDENGAVISSSTLPQPLNGSAVMAENGQTATCTFEYNSATVTYVVAVKDLGRKLEFVSKTGSLAGSVAEVDFYRSYDVENFESYATTGQGRDANNGSRTNNTGLRAAFFSNYSTSSTAANLNGNLMGSGDYLNLANENDNKFATLKGNSSVCRFYSINAYNGIPLAIGKGTEFSFRAKKAYATYNANTGVYGGSAEAEIEVRVFSSPLLTVSNIEQCESKTFKITNTDWTTYKLNLDPSKIYYGYAFYAKTAGSYQPIDDIKITSTPAPRGSYVGNAHVKYNSTEFDASVVISIGNNAVGVKLSNQDAGVTGYSYHAGTKTFTIQTNGSFSYLILSASYGTITFHYNDETDTISNVGLSGSIKNYVTNNNSITMARPTLYSNCDDTTAYMKSAFKRRWNDGSWKVDGPGGNANNADSINMNSYTCFSGNGSMRVRNYSGGLLGINLMNDVNIASTTISNIGFWVYNSMDTQVLMRVFIYLGTGLNNHNELISHKEDGKDVMGIYIPSKTWTFFAVGFSNVGENDHIRNIQIAFNKSTAYQFVDELMLY